MPVIDARLAGIHVNLVAMKSAKLSPDLNPKLSILICKNSVLDSYKRTFWVVGLIADFLKNLINTVIYGQFCAFSIIFPDLVVSKRRFANPT